MLVNILDISWESIWVLSIRRNYRFKIVVKTVGISLLFSSLACVMQHLFSGYFYSYSFAPASLKISENIQLFSKLFWFEFCKMP